MLKTNRTCLVAQAAQGKIQHPIANPSFPYRMEHDGNLVVVPTIGSITYDVRVGDNAFGLVGDHVEPCVSILNPDRTFNSALCLMSCIGNHARVLSGEAKGAVGRVTGIHGGCDHVIIDFPPEILEKMAIGDEILVRTYGQGLKLEDYPDIKIMSIDPDLFEQLGIREEGGQLAVPVAAVIPAHLMGAGLGENSAYTGDYDLMTADMSEICKYHLETLRFGDLVFLENCDNSYGRCFRNGAASIGVVIHGDCAPAGHGPGITTIMTTSVPGLKPIVTPAANLAHYFGIADKK